MNQTRSPCGTQGSSSNWIARSGRPMERMVCILSMVAVIESCLAQLGWGIDGRIGASGIVLHFNDPGVGVRELLVTCGESIAVLSLTSRAWEYLSLPSAPRTAVLARSISS